MSNITNNRQRKALIDKINQLGLIEHQEILKLLKQDGTIPLSRNRNGVFANVRDMSDGLIDRINKFVNFCLDNKVHLDQYDKHLNECKLNNNLLLNTNKYKSTNVSNICSFADMLKNNLDVKQSHTNIETMLQECSKYDENIESLMGVLDDSYNKINRKQVCNTKYANAKKRFARRQSNSKAQEGECCSTLFEEPYIRYE